MKISRTLLLIVAVLVPPGVTAVVSRSLQYPRRFAEVVPDGVYRGGFPTAAHIQALRSEKHIKTVVSLTDLKDEPSCVEEVEAVKEGGLRLLRFPMPGDGRGEFSTLDQAADAIGDKANWPVFFHCGAGKQRSNAVLAAYRVRKCGWTIDQALNELEDKYDLDPEKESTLIDHLRAYAKRIVQPARMPRRPSKDTPDE
ncbi:MAG TPA: hypothetical protein VMV94_05870 [Phycisphaerae bacterium]|nr:hypothetical protein [Phycisphaerae bacterium]